MNNLNLNEIRAQLENEFSKNDEDNRKLIFWYDDKADFSEEIEEFELSNAKIHHLTKTNQFATKLLLEREDPDSNYLIYAPFEKPDVTENHLEDIYLYSLSFKADKLSMIRANLGISDEYSSLLDKYSEFFRNKSRVNKFERLKAGSWNKESIELAIIGTLVKADYASFSKILQRMILSSKEEQDEILEELEKYKILERFWSYCEKYFDYSSSEHSLENLVNSFFITLLLDQLGFNDEDAVPFQWNNLNTTYPGDTEIFFDDLVNNVKTQRRFVELAREVESRLQVESVLKELDFDIYQVSKISVFPIIDELVLNWLVASLISPDLELESIKIDELIQNRSQTYFGSLRNDEYQLILNAKTIIENKNLSIPKYDSFKDALQDYTNNLFKIDQAYRKFYYYYDKLVDNDKYSDLKKIIDSVYSNYYLQPLTQNWNKALEQLDFSGNYNFQKNFKNILDNFNSRTAVIISDGMRYEVGEELFDRIYKKPYQNVEFTEMVSSLPSYTQIGMGSLLPHYKIELNDNLDVLVNDQKISDLSMRERILKDYDPNSLAIQYKDIKELNTKELREKVRGSKFVYIYHNKIDKVGDENLTENDVFSASEDAITEIENLIKKLFNSGNFTNIIVTADHGFLYKREKLEEYEKLPLQDTKSLKVNKRFIISEDQLDLPETFDIKIGKVLNNDDDRYITFPETQRIFKTKGSGLNYVHGGTSPQEMIIPLIQIKSGKKRLEEKKAQINVINKISKITNKITKFEFYQLEPIGENVIPGEYNIYFVDSEGNKISNTRTFKADISSQNVNERQRQFSFNFSDKQYDRNDFYYLIIEDAQTHMPVVKEEVIIDLAFNLGFFD